MASEPSSKPLNKGEIYDVVIIGGGPAGLTASIYAARANLNTVLLDRNPAAGALGVTNKIENYPGIPRVMTGLELLSILREQAQAFGATIINAQVIGIDFDKDPREVMTADRAIYRSKTVIIATGSMGRKPTIKGEKEFLGRGVSYCAACDAPFFKNEGVVVVGEIKEVLEEVDLISKFAGKVSVVTPSRDLTPEQTESLRVKPNVELIAGHKVLEILGENTVKGIIVADFQGNEQNLEASGVFVYLHGIQPVVDFLYGALDMMEDGCIKVNREDMSTSVDGVYAVGDVTCKKIRQVVIASGEGCIAALSADKYINKWQRVRPQWS